FKDRAAALGAVAVEALLLTAIAEATPGPLPIPSIPGAAALPGPVAPASTPAANMGALKTAPDIGLPETGFTLSGTGLAPGKAVSVVWNTANVTWAVDARPDSVDYLNLPQSPIRWAVGQRFAFSVTKDAGPPKARFDWPVQVAPTINATTTMSAAGLTAGEAKASVDSKAGPVLTKVAVSATGL